MELNKYILPYVKIRKCLRGPQDEKGKDDRESKNKNCKKFTQEEGDSSRPVL